MEDVENCMVGTYRPKTDTSFYPGDDPPPYPGKERGDFEVKIVPIKDEIYRNGETAANGAAEVVAQKDGDERFVAKRGIPFYHFNCTKIVLILNSLKYTF